MINALRRFLLRLECASILAKELFMVFVRRDPPFIVTKIGTLSYDRISGEHCWHINDGAFQDVNPNTRSRQIDHVDSDEDPKLAKRVRTSVALHLLS